MCVCVCVCVHVWYKTIGIHVTLISSNNFDIDIERVLCKRSPYCLLDAYTKIHVL